MQKDDSGKLNLQVEVYEINGSYFDLVEKELIENKTFGSIDKAHKYQIEDSQQSEIVGKIIGNLEKAVKEIEDSKKSKAKDSALLPRLRVDLIMIPNQKQDIKVELNDFRIHLVTAIYLQLLDFTKTDEPITQVQKSKLPINLLNELEEVKEQLKKEDSTVATNDESQLILSVEIRNIVVTMPSTHQKTNYSPCVIALRGIFIQTFY